MIHSLLLASENSCNAVRCIIAFTRLTSSVVVVEVCHILVDDYGKLTLVGRWIPFSSALFPSRKLFILPFSYGVVQEAFLQ